MRIMDYGQANKIKFLWSFVGNDNSLGAIVQTAQNFNLFHTAWAFYILSFVMWELKKIKYKS